MANTGLRPDEAARLEFRDVRIVKDHGSKETILEFEVRGKRGIGWCKSMANVVRPFKRLQARKRQEIISEAGQEVTTPSGRPVKRKPQLVKPGPTDRLFPARQHKRGLLNTILDEPKLKRDRDGNVRTAYGPRHTYIRFRLMEGADIYQIATNSRSSVEMIEKFHAAHVKTMLDATGINVRKGVIRRERKSREGGPEDAVRTDRRTRKGGRTGHRRERRGCEGGMDQR